MTGSAMRLLFLVLLLANALYFVWDRGGLAVFGWVPARLEEREPQRLAQQVRPEALQIRAATPSRSEP